MHCRFCQNPPAACRYCYRRRSCKPGLPSGAAIYLPLSAGFFLALSPCITAAVSPYTVLRRLRLCLLSAAKRAASIRHKGKVHGSQCVQAKRPRRAAEGC